MDIWQYFKWIKKYFFYTGLKEIFISCKEAREWQTINCRLNKEANKFTWKQNKALIQRI